jgi:thiamine-monophosphate kinase|tara:strand:- start:541 stop:1536 length:996 start_codon:yes stop_codon:yes gene_type:complete
MTESGKLTEFELIARYFSDVGCSAKSAINAVPLSIGDDCALISVPPGQELAISIDTLVAGCHFPEDASPYDIGQRVLAVSVSDLAAMGASPLAFTLALTLPEVDQDWLSGFSQGLRKAADHYGMPLIGGDTTRGPLTLTVQVHGAVESGRALRRSGAHIGDSVFVTGTLGDAAAALAMIQQRLAVTSEEDKSFLLSRFYCPEARVKLAGELLVCASAAIDISDGLLADLGHLCRSSAVAAKIYSQRLPLSSVLDSLVAKQQSIDYALTGGDDYELCFTAAPAVRKHIEALSQQCGIPITEIGEIIAGDHVVCVGPDGVDLAIHKAGYQHFR